MATDNRDRDERSGRAGGDGRDDRRQGDERGAGQRNGDRQEALEDLKDEVAEEVGVDPDKYGGNVPAKKWGALGGHMVKRLIEKGEEALADEDGAGS